MSAPPPASSLRDWLNMLVVVIFCVGVATTWGTLGPLVWYALSCVYLDVALFRLFFGLGVATIGSLLLPWLVTFCTHRRQSLRSRYRGAKWALVTGGSSGIGRSLCDQLAGDGLNIVLVGMDDGLLAPAGAALAAAHPDISVRVVGANLGASDPAAYMVPIQAATSDIDVSLLFNNAGYMLTSFFDKKSAGAWLANHHCNSTAPVVLAHHFVTRLRARGLPGAVVFTSSPANIFPSPFSALYGSTKAAVSHLATSLAAELAPAGIDVAVVHPSPAATAFYQHAVAMPTLTAFKGTATGPDAVAAAILAGVGRSVVIDQGYYPIVFRLLFRIFEVTAFAEVVARCARGGSDFRALEESQAETPFAVENWLPGGALQKATLAEGGGGGGDGGAGSARKKARGGEGGETQVGRIRSSSPAAHKRGHKAAAT